MRRVYFSFLGTNDYVPCNYTCDGRKVVSNVRFVQEATVAWNCVEWNSDDVIYIFTTKESHESNWVDNWVDDGTKMNSGLSTRLSSLNIPAGITEVRVPAGKDEDEIWQIFQTVFEHIQDGDQLYLDITHAFRSLPLLALVILNYAKITKNIRVKAIEYGAMEALGAIKYVKSLELEKRNVPVFNLLPYDQLLDWSTAIDKFVSAGDVSGVQKLTDDHITPRLKKTKGQDEEAVGLRNMAKHLGNFALTMDTCRGKSIVQNAAKLKYALKDVENQSIIVPLAPLIQKIQESAARFTGEEILDGIAAARWCLEHKLIQQGVTILQETFFSYIIRESIDEDIHDNEKRVLVAKAVRIELNSTNFNEWDRSATEHKQLVEKICVWLRPQETVLECMRNLTSMRNDLNHAGMNINPMNANKFVHKLTTYLNELETVVRENAEQL
uniref:TIGR02221 family CRISPR-associated protein n=1 Tax=Candidatus Electrothrix sp. TaxID=2170559 RepID=UPI004057CA3C